MSGPKVTDKQRLDWIQENGAEVCCIDTKDEKFFYVELSADWTTGNYASVRAAIDCAMKKRGKP